MTRTAPSAGLMLWKGRESRPPAGGSATPEGIWPSPGMAELLESVGRLAPARVLDLGPVQESTLQLLAKLHLEVHVAALEIEAGRRARLPEYDSGSFAGILGWDYLVRARHADRPRIADAFCRWLAPGGVALLVLPIASSRGMRSYRFRACDASRIEYLPQGFLDPADIPSTRAVLEMFAELECSGARILRHGAREFVLRKPRVTS